MTGGRVVVLGPTGRNFAAGMSGGIAYVLDEDGQFERRCNTEMVGLSGLDDLQEIVGVRRLVERHAEWTGSKRAKLLLADWQAVAARFVRVIPHDYRRVLEAEARMRDRGLPEDAARMAAFEEVSAQPLPPDAAALGA